MVERFNAPVTLTDAATGAEANEVIKSAYVKMSSWIDENIDRLLSEAGGKIDAAVDDLKGKIEQLKNEDQQLVDRLRTEIAGVQANLPNPSPQITAEVQKLTQLVNTYLQEREKKWTKIGETVGEGAKSLLKKAVGLPF